MSNVNLESLGLRSKGEDVIINHKSEELKSVANRKSAAEILALTKDTNRVSYDSISFEALQREAEGQDINKGVLNIISDYIAVGTNKVNTALQKLINTNFSAVGEPCKREAAHLSVNLTRSSDGNQFSVVDKDLIKGSSKLFKHEGSEVVENAIIQKVPEGQMESTAMVLNPEFEQLDILYAKVAELANILAVKSAENIKVTNKEQLKDILLNLTYILNKGSIRNMIDSKILAGMNVEEAKVSTKADRYEQVTNMMNEVNNILGTFALSSHVATIELDEWNYSIFEQDGARGSKAKGRKYFKISDTLIMKVDMKGGKIGGKYPIDINDIDEFKSDAAKLQILFLTVMENMVRSELGLTLFPLPECEYSSKSILVGKENEKIISYIINKNGVDLDPFEVLKESKINVMNAVEKVFRDSLASKMVDKMDY